MKSYIASHVFIDPLDRMAWDGAIAANLYRAQAADAVFGHFAFAEIGQNFGEQLDEGMTLIPASNAAPHSEFDFKSRVRTQ